MKNARIVCAGLGEVEVVAFSVREAANAPFSIDVEVTSADSAIDLSRVVGLGAAFHLEFDGRTRAFEGVLAHAALLRAIEVGQRALATYSVRLVAKMYLLTQRRRQRVFRHQSIPEIVASVLADWGAPASFAFDPREQPKLDMKVQYDETDANFVHRLLEEAGLSYVTDEGGAGICVSHAMHADPPHGSLTLPFSDSASRERAMVTHVRIGTDLSPSGASLRDYDFRRPRLDLTQGSGTGHDLFRQNAFCVDRDAGCLDASYGALLARRYGEAVKGAANHLSFTTTSAAVRPGMHVEITGHASPVLDKPVLVTALVLEGKSEVDWTSTVEARSVSTPFTPALQTPKPKIAGVQSATVVGPAGDEIHVDEHGRVQVRFAWDATSAGVDTSCYARVSQGWAGVGFGIVAIPRVGQEVIVAFLDGDPDAPLVIGRVFNAVQSHPYKLPENKTVSGIRTRSTPSSDGFNELRLEDKAGAEHFYVQAERDYEQLVKRDSSALVQRDQRVEVGQDRQTVVRRNRADETTQDRSTVVGRNDSVAVGADRTTRVKGNRSDATDGMHRTAVAQDRQENVGGARYATVRGDMHVAVGGKHRSSAEEVHITARGDERHAVHGALHFQVGGDSHTAVAGSYGVRGETVHLKAGTNLVLAAGARLTIRGPGGFIDFHDGGIDIVGDVVRINSGGQAAVGAEIAPVVAEIAVTCGEGR
jgi:type VI secretion system secreted protein VgrG